MRTSNFVATTVPPGLTVTGITNTGGTITANVAAACNATLGANTVVLRATDSAGLQTNANLTVNVTANTPPTLGTYANANLVTGAGATVTPSVLTDNGSVVSVMATDEK